MKSKLVAATIVAGLGALAVPQAASAQALGIYGNLGYSHTTEDDAKLGGVTGRLGVDFGPYAAVEGEATFGVKDDTIAGANVSLDHQIGVYGVG